MPTATTPDLVSARHTLLEQIALFGAVNGEAWQRQLVARLEATLDAASPEALSNLARRVVETGADWTYYAPDPLAVRIQDDIAELAVTPESTVSGQEHLSALGADPALFFSNHLSYADANLLSVLLTRSGYGDLARRLTVIAGPKVYSDPVRRFSSLCFGTIKTPQSVARSSEDAVMSPREVARVARETINLTRKRQEEGDAILIFAEGTRSRTGGMQRALPAVARYFEPPGPRLFPIGIMGSQHFLPVGAPQFHVSCISVRIGRPGDPAKLADGAKGNRRLAMDAVGVAIARLLPPEYRGAYAGGSDDLAEAERLSDAVFGT